MTEIEEDKPNRPNANYSLSKPQVNEVAKGEEKLVFYYNREHRLEKAPQAVRDLYNRDKKQRGFSLFRPLVADKPRATLFFTIVVMCVVIFLLSVFGAFDGSYLLDGNKVEINGILFEGTTIIVIKKTVKDKRSGYTGAVEIAVSPVIKAENEELSIFRHRVYFTKEPIEQYRFVSPYDSAEQLMVLQSEKSTLKINIKPQ